MNVFIYFGEDNLEVVEQKNIGMLNFALPRCSQICNWKEEEQALLEKY